MAIIFDFDDVLFNTKKFKEALKNLFKKYEIDNSLFEKTYYAELKNKNTKIKVYDLKKQVERIKKFKKIPKEFDIEIKKFLADTHKYVFEDVKPFFKKYEKEKLYILSMPDTEFQKQKIKNSRLTKQIKRLVLVKLDKSTGLKKIDYDKEEVFFVDDREEQIRYIKKADPKIKTVLMQRKEGRYSDKLTQYCDFEAKNMAQVTKIIEDFKKERRHS